MKPIGRVLSPGQIPRYCELRYWASEPTCFRSPVVGTLEGFADDDADGKILLLRVYLCEHHYQVCLRSRHNPRLMELTRLEDYETI